MSRFPIILLRTLKAAALGGVLGGVLASFDGFFSGVLLGDGTLHSILSWMGWWALAGAALGGLVGGFIACFAEKLLLLPPDEDEQHAHADGASRPHVRRPR